MIDMATRKRLSSRMLLAIPVLAWASPALAGGRGADAEALFEQGKTLVEAGRFREACPLLAESLAKDPGLGTMLWLADCYENNGQTASAWGQFKDAAAKASLTKDPREKVARERVASLERQLARLEVLAPNAGAAGEVEIRRDGVIVSRAELGVPIPLDPGTHTVLASSLGKKSWMTTIRIAPRPGTTAVIIPALEPNDAGAIARPGAGATAGHGQRVTALVVGGVGLAALGVGAGFSFAAKTAYDESNANGRCVANQCDAAGLDLRDEASSKALVATVAMGTGAAALVGGALLYFTARRSDAVAVTPSVSRHGGSLAVAARF